MARLSMSHRLQPGPREMFKLCFHIAFYFLNEKCNHCKMIKTVISQKRPLCYGYDLRFRRFHVITMEVLSTSMVMRHDFLRIVDSIYFKISIAHNKTRLYAYFFVMGCFRCHNVTLILTVMSAMFKQTKIAACVFQCDFECPFKRLIYNNIHTSIVRKQLCSNCTRDI